jgi:hypothetical protein
MNRENLRSVWGEGAEGESIQGFRKIHVIIFKYMLNAFGVGNENSLCVLCL